MNEQDDKLLHDWVRHSLDTYRSPYDPQDWAQLRRILRRKRWWRRGILASMGVLVLGSLSWYFGALLTVKPLEPHLKTFAKKNPATTRVVTTTTAPVRQPAVALPVLYNSSSRGLVSTYSTSTVSPRFQTQIAFLTAKCDIKIPESSLTEQIRLVEPVAFSPEEAAITDQVVSGNFGSDSTTYRVIARNLRQWPDAVLVCDLTTSMYPYVTQLVAVLKRYASNPSVQGMVFFTDCDSLGQQTYPHGPPGRMFITRSRSADTILPVLLRAARNTARNEDNDENDVEALLIAQREFPQAKHLILIADNMSSVKDIPLLDGVRKPVHVVLCGTTGSRVELPFQTDYNVIASQTNGSLHTLEDDLLPKTLTATTTLRVGEHYYRYRSRKKQFKLTPFTHRPRRTLGFMWW